MIDVLLSGAIFTAPTQRTGASGKPFVTTKVKAATGDEVVFANVIAFSDTACKALAALAVGDAVAISGPLKLGTYQASNGDTRVSVDVTANQVLTAYHIKRKRAAVQQDDDGTQQQPRTSYRGRSQQPASSRDDPLFDGELGDL